MELPPFKTLRIRSAQEPRGFGPYNDPVQFMYEVELCRGEPFRSETVLVTVTAGEAVIRGLKEPAHAIAAYLRYWLIDASGSMKGGSRQSVELHDSDREFLESVDPMSAARLLDTVLPMLPEGSER